MTTTVETVSVSVPMTTGAARGTRVRLSAEEEADLARQWRYHRNQDCRDRLVTANLGLVVAIASRYRNAGVALEELIAEGNLGLLSAVDGFDPECGSRFSAYAAYWIRQGISRAFAANSPRGRLKGRDRRDLMEYERAQRTFYAHTGRPPTDAEVARELGWGPERVTLCRTLHLSHARPSSLDYAAPDGTTRTVHPAAPDILPTAEPGESSGTVAKLMVGLPEFERRAVEMRFGLDGAEPQSVEMIAQTIGRSRREVRRALRSGLAQLARRARPRASAATQEVA